MFTRPAGRHTRPTAAALRSQQILAAAVLGSLVTLGAALPADAAGKGEDNRTTMVESTQNAQGASPSDPDGMDNGGPDKPGYTGGRDTTDQDGNNGSGNDSDCEDDNRGIDPLPSCDTRTQARSKA